MLVDLSAVVMKNQCETLRDQQSEKLHRKVG